jgi:hypothetical protein
MYFRYDFTHILLIKSHGYDGAIWFHAPEKSLCYQILNTLQVFCEIMFFGSLIHFWSQSWTKSGQPIQLPGFW